MIVSLFLSLIFFFFVLFVFWICLCYFLEVQEMKKIFFVFYSFFPVFN